ncbi:MAG: N-acetylneuraminate synthase family protein [Pseudomonadota bacterium]|nr:N-acetylneuraminate synthase family protein [Pseudomonadota bacterium]
MKPFLIAEIGINHNGDIEIAKKLIDFAQEARFDAVKFQKRDVNSVYTKEFLDGYRESPWGKTQRDQKLGLEFNEKEYKLIDDYCSKKKIQWFASAWDINSQKFLRKFDLKYNKVASAMLGNFPLLREIASEKKYTFISTGMSTLEEIDKVVKLFKDHKCPYELMHCNSSYPMRDSDANLSCIKLLKEKFNCDVGYSGHENSLIGVSIIAVALGATSVERHITLDRTMYGSDQAASLEAKNLKILGDMLRNVKSIIGDGKKRITDQEKVIRKKLRIDKN